MTEIPYWWEDAPPRALDPCPVQPECDVAIVGAGYTGLTAALYLARAGMSVQVFDREDPGFGASTRNGGITSGTLRIGPADALKRFGAERGLGMHLEAVEARRFLKKLIESNRIDCDYALTGLFMGSLTLADFYAQQQAVGLANERLGASQRVIEKNELPSVTGSTRYVGGVVNPEIGTFHPAKFLRGLLDRALASGVVVHGRNAVQHVAPSAQGFAIQTARGACRAEHVIVATNGYTDGVSPWLRRRLVPINSRIIVTEELPPNLIATLIPDNRAMGEMRKLYYYYRRSPDGKRIMLGGREPAWSWSRAAAVGHLRAGLVSLFPELEDVRITHSWAGKVAFSRNNLPLMFSHEGMHFAVGYCGSGTVWAPWLGYKTAMKILGETEAAASHFDGPVPKAVPLYSGTPWFLPFVISSYGIEDRLRGRGRITE